MNSHNPFVFEKVTYFILFCDTSTSSYQAPRLKVH